MLDDAHFRQAGDEPELALQRRGQRGRDGVRACPGKRGIDRDRRPLQQRQRSDRKQPIGDDAQQRRPRAVNSVVATGRRTKGSEKFILGVLRSRRLRRRPEALPVAAAPRLRTRRSPPRSVAQAARRPDRRPASRRASETATPTGRRRPRCRAGAAAPSRCRCRWPSGSAPNSAAMVVIMIGRKRSMQA